jgi:hypothetical protein
LGQYLGYLFAGVSEEGGLFRSESFGARWSATDLPVFEDSSYVQCFSFADSVFFAGSNNGVFRSTDFGQTWNDVGDGLPKISIQSLVIYGHKLFAGTRGAGIWVRPLSEIGSSKTVSVTNLSTSPLSIVPNPFSKSTSIRFSMMKRGYTSISIVDLLGREISVLFQGLMDSGQHSIDWKPSGVLPGVYELVFNRDGRFTRSSPIILTP